jgi:2-octaprenylphenol hydroxylase
MYQEHTRMPAHNNCAPTDFDIIVVGAGMVGLSFALAMASSGLRLAMLDSRPPPATDDLCKGFDPRVSAITPASQHFLSSLGAWDGIEKRRCSAYTDMHVWDADGTGSIHFTASDIHAKELGHIVENSVILAALHERLALQDNIHLLAPVTLTALQLPRLAGDAVHITLDDGRILSARLLVAADGANSKVRELAAFKTKEWDYEQHAIVTTVKTELCHRQCAIQRFMDAGTLAFLPLREDADSPNEGQHYSSIVWSVVPEYAQTLMALDDKPFAVALQGGIENRLGTVESVDKRLCFPLRQRHATDYVQPGVALIGDAAHTIHPLAGQGVNLGFQDASTLARELLQALARTHDIASLRTLRRYQRRCIGHNLGMMWIMEGFKRLFADQPLPLRWLRNVGMSGLDRASMLKHRLMRAAMGIDGG